MTKHIYVSREPDEHGFIHYPEEDHATWAILYERQRELVHGRACKEYVEGLDLLEFSQKQVPQHLDVTRRLDAFHGWGVQQVPALIPASEFFNLLSRKRFPAASFIRTPNELDYIMEPDIFHEFFGHCPLLTLKPYADFMHEFGKIALSAKPKDRVQLFRLFWFTVEFGLINTPYGIRAYGGGILSSKEETVYSVESTTPQRVKFDPVTVLRTPFRIDILQPLYFVIGSFEELFGLIDQDVMGMLAKARELGDFAPLFPPKENGKSY